MISTGFPNEPSKKIQHEENNQPVVNFPHESVREIANRSRNEISLQYLSRTGDTEFSPPHKQSCQPGGIVDHPDSQVSQMTETPRTAISVSTNFERTEAFRPKYRSVVENSGRTDIESKKNQGKNGGTTADENVRGKKIRKQEVPVSENSSNDQKGKTQDKKTEPVGQKRRGRPPKRQGEDIFS